MSEAVETPRRRRWRSWLWKLPLVFVAFSVLQVLVLRVVDPPFSTFMVARQMDAVFAGDFNGPEFARAAKARGYHVTKTAAHIVTNGKLKTYNGWSSKKVDGDQIEF